MGGLTMGTHQGLSVRRHERHGAELRATVSLRPPSDVSVRFSAGSDIDGGAIPATLVDIGEGGLGLRATCFLPRGSDVCVVVHGPDGSVLLTAAARVRRVLMVNRGPEYQMGVSFVGEGREFASQVAAVRALADPDPTVKEGSRGG